MINNMRIRFSIDYNTSWGERLVLVIGKKRYDMRYVSSGMWQVELDDIKSVSSYTYEVWNGDNCIRSEYAPHELETSSKIVTVLDRWHDRPSNAPFWSSMFKDVIFRREPHKPVKTVAKGNVSFIFPSAEIRPSQAVAMTGSGKLFDSWKKIVVLDDSEFPYWKITLRAQESFEYKFVIVDRKTLDPIMWEVGDNRHFSALPKEGEHVIAADFVPQFPTMPWRGAGVAVPVFALRSEDSFGIGEFHDIKKLVDWAAATGQSVIQLLPVNDTKMTGTWQDSYPYNANSTFALHPQFIHLPDAGVRNDKAYRDLRDELNSLRQTDYEKVNDEKTRLLRKAYDSLGDKVMASDDYKAFFKENESWLLPYSVFCCLRDETGTVDFSKWGKMAKFSAKKVAEYASSHKKEVGFHYYEQYWADAQLKDAVAYAHSKGVALKGDLPIGISRTSVDAWAYPELYHLDSQAGAPPDAFSVDGQNWGFPTYNWEKMAEDGFSWWKMRMKKMSHYFDAFRIDHILGFFRIWEIPVPYKSGLMGHFSPALPYSADELRSRGFDIGGGRFVTSGNGEETDVLFLEDPRKKGYYHPRISAQNTTWYAGMDEWQKRSFNDLYDDFFYRRHNAFWKESAMKKLPSLLESTGMLTCGEDLGMIPDCVPEVMNELGILSLEIQRMPKSPRDEFADPDRYPYYCVCATGTHDTNTLRAWWEEDRAVTAHFWHNMLHGTGDMPWFCEPWVCAKIIDQHLKSPAMLCILPLQDWISIDGNVRYPGNPEDERINVPAIPRYYWRYRMHLTLEDLLSKSDLNGTLKGMIRGSSRNI